MKSIYSIVMLALVAFVLTAQTAHGEGVIRLQNGPLEPNTLGIGAPHSTGVTMLPNGTLAAYLNDGGPGSRIGPVHVTNWHNGTVPAGADFHIGKGNMSDLKLGHGPNETGVTVTPLDHEGDSNSTSNITDPSNSTQDFNATVGLGATRVCNR